jgi:hypothetical protein
MFVVHESLCQEMLFKVLNFSFLRHLLAVFELLVVLQHEFRARNLLFAVYHIIYHTGNFM